MLTVIERIKQEQEESLLRIRNHIMSGFRDLLFGDTAASIPALDFAEEPKTQPSVQVGPIPNLAKTIGRNGSLRRKGPGSKRTPEQIRITTNKLLSAIRTAPGSNIEFIGRQLDMSTKELAPSVNKLLAEKKIRKTGNKRATKYFPREAAR